MPKPFDDALVWSFLRSNWGPCVTTKIGKISLKKSDILSVSLFFNEILTKKHAISMGCGGGETAFLLRSKTSCNTEGSKTPKNWSLFLNEKEEPALQQQRQVRGISHCNCMKISARFVCKTYRVLCGYMSLDYARMLGIDAISEEFFMMFEARIGRKFRSVGVEYQARL